MIQNSASDSFIDFQIMLFPNNCFSDKNELKIITVAQIFVFYENLIFVYFTDKLCFSYFTRLLEFSSSPFHRLFFAECNHCFVSSIILRLFLKQTQIVKTHINSFLQMTVWGTKFE